MVLFYLGEVKKMKTRRNVSVMGGKMDKPLSEKDIQIIPGAKYGRPTFVSVDDVQSAKRLLKQKIEGYFWVCYDGIRDYDEREINEMVDACFQIPDGDNFSAENLGKNTIEEHKAPRRK